MDTLIMSSMNKLPLPRVIVGTLTARGFASDMGMDSSTYSGRRTVSWYGQWSDLGF